MRSDGLGQVVDCSRPQTSKNNMQSLPIPAVDLEILRGGFSFTKTPAILEVKTKNKKGRHQLFESFLTHS